MVLQSMDIPDNTLILRIAGNDYVSFNELFMRYYSRLCSSILEITHDKDTAEDIVQEFYIKLWVHRNEISIKENVRSYLFTSCRNAALNFIRNENTRKKSIEKLSDQQKPDDEDPSDMEDYLTKLETCIEQLPERSKQVFRMYKFEGRPQKEISEKLNISIKTIKNQIWKSLQYLRSCIEEKN